MTSATGEKVLRSPKIDDNYVVDSAIAVGDAVTQSTTVNRVIKAQAGTDALARVIGVARTVGTTVGTDTVEIVSHGPCPGVISAATAQTPYFLQATGGIGSTLPAAGNRTIQVGIAINATDLWVRIVDFGKRV